MKFAVFGVSFLISAIVVSLVIVIAYMTNVRARSKKQLLEYQQKSFNQVLNIVQKLQDIQHKEHVDQEKTIENIHDQDIKQAVIQSEPSSKYAFVYVGQPRSWLNAIPKWRDIFQKYKPDIYLFPNTLDSGEKLTLEKVQEVFGQDCTIQAIHHWTLEDQKDYESTVKEKNSRIVRFIRKDLKNYKRVQDESQEEWKIGLFSLQFAQVQKAFRMYDFSSDYPYHYDGVFKMRFDTVPSNVNPFSFSKPWSVENVAPHVLDMWKKNPNFKDRLVNGRSNSGTVQQGKEVSHNPGRGESYSLGGAFTFHDSETLDVLQSTSPQSINLVQDKVVWMFNDYIYWSTAQNMQILNENIYDNYSDYLDVNLPYSWTPEANLILHTRNHRLLPLMTLQSCHILRN